MSVGSEPVFQHLLPRSQKYLVLMGWGLETRAADGERRLLHAAPS